MDDPSPHKFISLIIALICLIILSCIFSISESSFLGMNRLRLRILRNKKNKKAIKAGKLLDKKDELINTLLISNDIVNILISSLITAVAIQLFGEKGVGIATIVATVLLLIFGEITPKTISTRWPDKIAYSLSFFITVIFYIMRPVVIIVTAISSSILKIFGIHTRQKKATYTEDEIKTFFEIGMESGVLEKDENSMMNKVFKFSDLEAQDIMVPRTKITAIPDTATYRSVIEISLKTNFTRFPVYKKSIDDIVGILYLKDLLKFKNNTENFSVVKIMRKPIFIPATKKMSAAQKLLNENRQSMAIVVDEYSGTDGIITVTDIAREIFSMPDEKTLRGKIFNFSEIENKDDFEINGSVLIFDLKNTLHIPLESKINETIGGWFTEKINRMPKNLDTFDFNGYKFIVKKIQSNRIERLQILKIADTNEEGV